MQFVIVKENLTLILELRGSEVMKFITVNESNESEVNLLEWFRTPQDIVKQFHSVFHDEVGTLLGVQHLETDPEVLPSVS